MAWHTPQQLIGRLQLWTCCSQHITSKPCKGAENHLPLQYRPGELEQYWKFRPTNIHQPGSGAEPHVAIVLDCEMGVAQSGESELIRVTAIDYFTGEVLVDSLVWPDVKMAHYNTRYSGVTASTLHEARRKGKCILGRDQARAAVCRFVGADTIVIGHSLNMDFTSLRWIHPVVIDTYIIEKERIEKWESEVAELEWDDVEALPLEAELERIDINERGEKEDSDKAGPSQKRRRKKGGPLSLKGLALERLGRHIQAKWHDSLEDVIATRDILHWYITNPEDATFGD